MARPTSSSRPATVRRSRATAGSGSRSGRPPVFNHSGAPRRRLIFLSGVVPVLFTAVVSVYRPALFDRLDRAAYASVPRIAGANKPGPGIVIVDVDERSLAATG